MSDFWDDWTDLLPLNPLFEQLREEGADVVKNGNVMCEIRGDLFLWSSAKSAILTTNLKRLKAHPSDEQTFQTLMCTTTPLTSVSRLLPDGPGMHIALVSRQAVSVLALPRSRGRHGEFGGGQLSVNCRVTPIATDLFTIHHKTLHLLQAQWHPSLSHSLLLLTSDSTLRCFSMADPNYARYSIPLTPSAASQVHGCTLEDSVVSFTCTQGNRLFALRDTGDVVVADLSLPDTPPSEPLPMHPMSYDNYGNEATSLLVLETVPPTLVIAHSSGTLYHCVYMEGDKERGTEGEEDPTQTHSDNLYVVESVKLDLQLEDESISLTRDPVLPYRYYISHSQGVNMVTIPWANRMDQFITSSVEELVMRADSDIQLLIDVDDPSVTSVQGMVVISEPLLGQHVVFFTSDLECRVLSLRSPPPSQYVTESGPSSTKPHPQVKSDTSGLEKMIRDIFEECQDTLVLSSQKTTHSQQQCFDFLQCSVQYLKKKYLLPQQKAKATLQRRLDILGRQKEQQLRDLVALRDENAEMRERSEELRWRAKEIEQKSSQLMMRLERLLCQLDAQSPILSDAEVSMEHELSQLQTKLKAMYYHLEEAKGKLRLGYGEVATGRSGIVKMSKSQDSSICSVLEDIGRRLIFLKLQVKGLMEAMPT